MSQTNISQCGAYVCVFVYACECSPIHIYVKARGWLWVFSTLFWFWHRIYHWNQNTLSQLDWLTSETPGSNGPHSHQVCTDIPSLSEQKWLKLKSSCLYSKTFYWSIFPAPIHINISLTYILKIKCLPSSILLVLKARVCRAIIMLTKISLV